MSTLEYASVDSYNLSTRSTPDMATAQIHPGKWLLDLYKWNKSSLDFAPVTASSIFGS